MSKLISISSEEIAKFFRRNREILPKKSQNTSEVSFDSSEVSFDSSEVSFDSSEVLFLSSVENFHFLASYWEIAPWRF